MRVAILADVHSNIHALRAVLDAVRSERADSVACAGDIVGYGAYPNETCREVRQSAAHAVLGNHDHSALVRDTSFMNQYAAKAALWTASVLDEASKGYISGLQVSAGFDAGGRRATMYHGSIESYTEYVFEEDLHEGMLSRAKADVLILGHTHVPYVRKFTSGLVVNPGSVGQPRDGDWRASFAMLDTETMECAILRREYDIDAAARGIDSAGLPSYLADRLYLGK